MSNVAEPTRRTCRHVTSVVIVALSRYQPLSDADAIKHVLEHAARANSAGRPPAVHTHTQTTTCSIGYFLFPGPACLCFRPNGSGQIGQCSLSPAEMAVGNRWSRPLPALAKMASEGDVRGIMIITVRLCEAYTHGIAVEILSVCPSVRPSVKRVHCDKTKAPS